MAGGNGGLGGGFRVRGGEGGAGLVPISRTLLGSGRQMPRLKSTSTLMSMGRRPATLLQLSNGSTSTILQVDG